ncbi:hypothetical protein PF005_g27696 [Phytophthora fragariae]|uniref:Uncharacterized protein n=1 Tax=Phytophthora fragariae TaxID=53985 RepID=A0A6A3RE59_9STRA|nr:hypothetical protein PF009_g20021 [Phytophthora fragariae]KAE9091821.1 hypothetical protein PF007_g18740 [Phytophthora fragariae]KAE9170097.1 hypothetical protein PF005_g27696 [Phytophthora fragariae]
MYTRICDLGVSGDSTSLVDDGGNALTSADAVPVDIEDVVALRDDVFAKVCRALPTMSSRPTSKSSQ